MSDKSSIEKIQAQWSKFSEPLPGQIYRHYKGGLYEIVAAGFIEATQEPCVIYKSLADHTVWVRTASDFFETIEYQGQTLSRFSLTEK